MRSKLLLSLFFFLYVPGVMAQEAGGEMVQKHIVYFKDKIYSPYSLQKPLAFLSPKSLERRLKQNIPLNTRDLPVNPAYVSGIKQTGATVWYTSRWLNAAVVLCTQEKLSEIEDLPYVVSSQNLNRIVLQKKVTRVDKPLDQQYTATSPNTLESSDYGLAYQQANMLGVVDLHAAGYNGEGITIAVFDTGFPAVNTLPAFAHLYHNKRLKGAFDFVDRKNDVYSGHAHGTMVLSTMAAFAPTQLIGTAFAANYLLFRTEDVASEHNIEEVNWLLAAEYADSAGVDIINSSLGYKDFQYPSVSYSYNQMDGNTALVTRAADFAAATGMLVVVSGGNDGNTSSRYIGAPADADSVLAVGAVNATGSHASFSSYGPSADGRIKPDVAALGEQAYVLNTSGEVVRSNGTSFASPILAGMAACLWQSSYGKSSMQMLKLIQQMGSSASAPNNTIGYGIPNYKNVSTGLPRYPAKEEVMIMQPVTNHQVQLTLGESFRQEAAMVHIFDTSGRLLFKQALAPNQFQYLLSPDLPGQGVYLCRVSTSAKAVTVRFVKL